MDEVARIPSLEEGKQFKFPGMVESVMLCRRMNWPWSSQPKSEY